MLQAFVEKIESLVSSGIQKFPEVKALNGHDYTPRPVHIVPEVVVKYPAPLAIHTLAGVIDYLRENRDQLNLEQIVVHVESPKVVKVVDRVEGDTVRQRVTHVTASADVLGETAKGPQFEFGTYHKPDTFLIGLLALFEGTEERDALVRAVGNITASEVKQAHDDGITQQVIGRQGVSLAENIVVSPIQALRPFRTFRELRQPESPFLFRAKRGEGGELPTVALFEADGGKWRLEAIEAIATRLQGGLGESPKTENIAVLA
jgi:hypothetical protein